jgi:FKBP-type peptidyl-prolyl cis-trans isomerase SlyD
VIIADNCVVTLAYTLRDDAGEVLDSATAAEPFAYLHGRRSVIAGLERELRGHSVGDRIEVSIAPADAYGEHSPARVQVVPRDRFPAGIDITPGMQFHASDEHGGQIIVRVADVDEDGVTVDANHPLAGQTLHFTVEVLDVRAATAEELAHGHVHGAGGHQH